MLQWIINELIFACPASRGCFEKSLKILVWHMREAHVRCQLEFATFREPKAARRPACTEVKQPSNELRMEAVSSLLCVIADIFVYASKKFRAPGLGSDFEGDQALRATAVHKRMESSSSLSLCEQQRYELALTFDRDRTVPDSLMMSVFETGYISLSRRSVYIHTAKHT